MTLVNFFLNLFTTIKIKKKYFYISLLFFKRIYKYTMKFDLGQSILMPI